MRNSDAAQFTANQLPVNLEINGQAIVVEGLALIG
jgi:hypothetical protein